MGACLLRREFVGRAHGLYARSARSSCSRRKNPRGVLVFAPEPCAVPNLLRRANNKADLQSGVLYLGKHSRNCREVGLLLKAKRHSRQGLVGGSLSQFLFELIHIQFGAVLEANVTVFKNMQDS